MKNLLVLFICTFLSFGVMAQGLIGGWESYHLPDRQAGTSETGEELKSVVIISDGYQVLTIHDAKTGKICKHQWRDLEA